MRTILRGANSSGKRPEMNTRNHNAMEPMPQNSEKTLAIAFARLWATRLINLFVNTAVGMLCALLLLALIIETTILTSVCSLLGREDWIEGHRVNGFIEVLNWCNQLECCSDNILHQTREIKKKISLDIPIFSFAVMTVGAGDPLALDHEAMLLQIKRLHEEETRFSACLAAFALALIRLMLFIS